MKKNKAEFMICAEDSCVEFYKKIVVSEDWQNLSRTAEVKVGAVGYIVGEDRGEYSILFSRQSKDKVKANELSMLACHGVPVTSVKFV